jgi:hypothetical protein
MMTKATIAVRIGTIILTGSIERSHAKSTGMDDIFPTN